MSHDDSLRARDFLLLLTVGCPIVLPSLGQERNWSSREARHALIAAQMAEDGDFLVPRRLDRLYRDKPPVLHAPVALLFRAFGGPSMLLARLPSAVASIVGAMALYALGCRLHGRRAALLAALTALATPGYARMARIARPDMIFGCAILLSYAALIAGMSREGRCERRGFLFLSGIFSALAVLAKGPYGFVFPVLLAVVAPFQKRDLRRPGLVEWALFSGALLLATGSWALPVFLRDGGSYLESVVFQPNLTLVGSGHRRPFYYYLGPALLAFLPFSLFLPAVLAQVRQRFSSSAGMALIVFIILSCVPRKASHYLVPWYPLVSLAVAASVEECSRATWRHLLRISIGASAAGLSLFFAVGEPLISPPEDPDRVFARETVESAPPGTTFLCYGSVADRIGFIATQTQHVSWRNVHEFDTTRALPPLVRRARSGERPCCIVVTAEVEKETLGALAEPPRRLLAERRVHGKTWRSLLLAPGS